MKTLIARRLHCLAPTLLFCGMLTGQCQYISVRVSVKYILDAAGQAPSGLYSTAAHWRQAIDNANQGNARLGRGFRFEYPTFDGNVSGYSQFFNLDNSEALPFEFQIRSNPAQTGWRADALNVYVVNANLGAPGAEGCAGWASNPEDVLDQSSPYNTMNGRIVVFCVNMSPSANPLSILSHEFGHHMGLIHTWGNDRVADTVVDADPGPCEQSGVPDWCACKFANTLALAAAQNWSQSVLRVATNNLMSYHCDNDLDFDLTEGQLDRWADIARRYLASEMTGACFFVDRNNSQTGNNGYSSNPFRTVQAGVAAATAGGARGNIVIVRPGSYNEQITLNQPVTLRATRTGWVTVGR